MDICFLDLREKEVVNVYNGRKLGRVIDILFDTDSGVVRGIVVPGDKKLFHRNDDVFVPLEKIRRIGGDVILVGLKQDGFAEGGFIAQNSYYMADEKRKSRYKFLRNNYSNSGAYFNNVGGSDEKYIKNSENYGVKGQSQSNYKNGEAVSYIRYKRLSGQKYK